MNEEVLDLMNLNVQQTELLNEYALKERGRFLENIGRKSKKYKKSLLWWITPFAARSDPRIVFDHICTFFFVEGYIRKNPNINTIITDQKLLYRVLKKNLDEKYHVKYIKGKKYKIPRWPFYFVFWYRKVKKYFLIKTNGRNPQSEVLSGTDNIYIDTYVLSNCVKENEYKDRYYSKRLPELAKTPVVFSLMSLVVNDDSDYADIIKKLENGIGTYRFIIKERFMSFTDYLCLWKYPLMCLKRAKDKFIYSGYDFTALMRSSLLEGSVSENSMEGYIAYCFVKKMKEIGYDIKEYHMWYEGQAINNGLIFALRKYFPLCTIYGNIGLPPHEKSMNFYTNELEHDIKMASDYITLIGKSFEKDYIKLCPLQKTKIAPAYRYSELGTFTEEKKKKGLLIVLSYFLDESQKLLEMVFEALEENRIDIEVKIKNHPVNMHCELKDYHVNTSCNYEFINGNMNEALSVSEIVICTGTTSGMEILSCHCKLLMYMPLGKISNTCIPDDVDKQLYRLIYDKKSFIENLQMMRKEERKIWFDQENYFYPVNDYTINAYINEKSEKKEKFGGVDVL